MYHNEEWKNSGLSGSVTGTTYLDFSGHRLKKWNREEIFSLCIEISQYSHTLGITSFLEASGI